MDFLFICNSLLLGAGLAMDAFSVSVANGLNEPGMPRVRMAGMAGVYAFFQFLMPMTGWICVRLAAARFRIFQPWIPVIALILLLYIGGSMLLEGIRVWRKKKDEAASGADHGQPEDGRNPEAGFEGRPLSTGTLLLQGIATSIDALSVGFTIAEYDRTSALVCGGLIALVTFGICMTGLLFGKRFGTKLEEKASILGGMILIFIGLEIFVKGWFGL